MGKLGYIWLWFRDKGERVGGELYPGGRKARHLQVQRSLLGNGENGLWMTLKHESLESGEYSVSHAIYKSYFTSQAKPILRKKTRGEVTHRRKRSAFFTSHHITSQQQVFISTNLAIECSIICQNQAAWLLPTTGMLLESNDHRTSKKT